MSINLDVDMEDAPPGGPREFTVPDPPQKPGFIHGVDNVHWSQSSRRLAAQLNHDKTGFDVKLYDPSDPTARGLDPSISPWYRLGPPSNIPDYPPLLEKYSVQMLEAAGFLNHDTGFDIAKINGRLAFAPWRNYHRDPDLQIRIHPVLRRDKWLGITDYQYSLMLPSLLLASAILDDPITLNYFCALSRPSADMKTVKHVSAGLTADCKIMEIPATLSYNDQQETYNKFILMTTYLESWSFEDVAGPIFGLTGRTLGVFGQPERASKLHTNRSRIRLKPVYMEILECFDRHEKLNDGQYERLFKDIQTMAGIPESRRARIDPVSAMYRTSYDLATLLLHEFTHAFCMAYFERPNVFDIREPWAPMNRTNEQGYAFENFALGGVLKSLRVGIPPIHDEFHSMQAVLAPFGLYTNREWDAWFGNPANKTHATMDSDLDHVEDRKPSSREYPVPQAWTQWLFSEDLWTDQVLRFGLEAIKVPKHKKWEVVKLPYGTRGWNGTGEHRWNTAPGTDDRIWVPNWDDFYLDGIPEEARVFKHPTWDP